MTDIPWIVSLDDHVVEPPDIWTSRLPAKYRDVGPHIVMAPAGTPILDGGTYREAPGTEGPDVAWWFYEDQQYSVKRLIAAAGYPAEEITFDGITFDQMRPGCWQPQARVEDMTINHVEASLSFPNYPRFCGQIFLRGNDKELSKLCVEAYNDWQVDEWCAGSNGRLIPLCLVPLWDAELAATEVRRNAARGVRAVAFSELPSWLGLPSIHTGYWEPFFQACAETDTVINMHIGSSSRMPATSPDAPAGVQATLSFNNAMGSLADWIFSGVLVRHPTLKLAYSEGQMGWIPYALERANSVWKEFRGWAFDTTAVPESPEYYFRRQVFACFFRDNFGLKNIEDVGIDNVTFETDYPHSDSTWPDTKQIFTDMVSDLDDEQVYKIARGNAIRMLSLDLD
jgi:predicted TIM-barrel fold metal-dependent hydrolase